MAAAALREELQHTLLDPQATGAPLQAQRLVATLRRRRWLLRRGNVRGALREELAEAGRQVEAAVETLQERMQAAHSAASGPMDAIVACVRAQRQVQPLMSAAELLGALKFGSC